MQINNDLVNYLNHRILPEYDCLDVGHGQDHIVDVMNRSREIATYFDADIEMALTIAAFHDIGRKIDRKKHALESARILREDSKLVTWFGQKQIEIMSEAIEQHMESYGKKPDTIYGMIVSQANQHFNFETIVIRAFQHGQLNYPKRTLLQQVDLIYAYVIDKYTKGNAMGLWLNYPKDKQNLQQILKILEIDRVYDIIYDICREYLCDRDDADGLLYE